MTDARANALEMMQGFCRTAPWGYSDDLDFYRLLWEVHGAILSHGSAVARESLYQLLDDREITPYNAPAVFAERLAHRGSENNDMGGWFERAMTDQ